MNPTTHLYQNIDDLCALIPSFREKLLDPPSSTFTGMVGFDGFIDTLIRMRQPDSMKEFGPKVAQAAGIAASYAVDHQGDKFGGNGPLFVAAFSDLFSNQADLSYVGGLGEGKVAPIFAEALAGKVNRLFTIAPPAHSDCMEFTDGKIMLGDFDACEEITLARMLKVMGQDAIDQELQNTAFISAVNWGKLPHVGDIWSYLATRSKALGRNAKEVFCFMDLAEFEHRSEADVQGLIARLSEITAQFTTLMSFNLKEAWQMGDRFGGNFQGKKDAKAVTELALLLRKNLDVDKIIIHPNDGAACADADGCTFVPGPYCQSPLISTGAGDNFGAGCMAACLLGLDNAGMLLTGNSTSGYYVRSGRTPAIHDLITFVESWAAGSLPERL
ncbi:hypothetical protein P3T73_04700 [Kiritimatiellota bacterium B12222]|nr:hypothetical protein P3T73_04700 [Kiritimatiellota bacterium B12222]